LLYYIVYGIERREECLHGHYRCDFFKFLSRDWLNPQMQSPWIWKAIFVWARLGLGFLAWALVHSKPLCYSANLQRKKINTVPSRRGPFGGGGACRI
jgi:hypothetical protein